MKRTRLFEVTVIAFLVWGAAGCSEGSVSGNTSSSSTFVDDQITVVPPTGPPLVTGLPRVDVLGPPTSGAGEAPLFSWQPVAGAVTYSMAVLGPEGPIWAWEGEGTEVRLGGLPFERPPGVGGPVVVAETCWSVVALDADRHVVAVSDFLPVSPDESPGHQCVPGSAS